MEAGVENAGEKFRCEVLNKTRFALSQSGNYKYIKIRKIALPQVTVTKWGTDRESNYFLVDIGLS